MEIEPTGARLVPQHLRGRQSLQVRKKLENQLWPNINFRQH